MYNRYNRMVLTLASRIAVSQHVRTCSVSQARQRRSEGSSLPGARRHRPNSVGALSWFLAFRLV